MTSSRRASIPAVYSVGGSKSTGFVARFPLQNNRSVQGPATNLPARRPAVILRNPEFAAIDRDRNHGLPFLLAQNQSLVSARLCSHVFPGAHVQLGLPTQVGALPALTAYSVAPIDGAYTERHALIAAAMLRIHDEARAPNPAGSVAQVPKLIVGRWPAILEKMRNDFVLAENEKVRGQGTAVRRRWAEAGFLWRP